MNGVAGRLMRVLGVLWAGSLWAMALWIAPLLFRWAPDRHAAGVIAAGLFRAQTLVSVVVAALAWWRLGFKRSRGVQLATALLVINDLFIRYLMDYVKVKGEFLRMGFGGWHGVSAAMYLIACLAALSVVWNDDLR